MAYARWSDSDIYLWSASDNGPWICELCPLCDGDARICDSLYLAYNHALAHRVAGDRINGADAALEREIIASIAWFLFGWERP